MKATNIEFIGSESAPDEWRRIPEVASANPSCGGYVSLQKLDNTNICVWMVNAGSCWRRCSDYFIITQ